LSNFTFVERIPQEGTSEIQVLQPEGIDIDSQDGNVYITDQGNARVQKFTRDGKFITK
jgi:DNA-binding beta-propeller fold protein YncE